MKNWILNLDMQNIFMVFLRLFLSFFVFPRKIIKMRDDPGMADEHQPA